MSLFILLLSLLDTWLKRCNHISFFHFSCRIHQPIGFVLIQLSLPLSNLFFRVLNILFILRWLASSLVSYLLDLTRFVWFVLFITQSLNLLLLLLLSFCLPLLFDCALFDLRADHTFNTHRPHRFSITLARLFFIWTCRVFWFLFHLIWCWLCWLTVSIGIASLKCLVIGLILCIYRTRIELSIHAMPGNLAN